MVETAERIIFASTAMLIGSAFGYVTADIMYGGEPEGKDRDRWVCTDTATGQECGYPTIPGRSADWFNLWAVFAYFELTLATIVFFTVGGFRFLRTGAWD